MKLDAMTVLLLVCSLAVLALGVGCGGKEDDPKDEAERALQDARRLAEAGDYPGALERHVWFHNNSLAIRPSYSGVRLSFALADWVELGKKYPPALEKLKSIRDEKTKRLGAGIKDRGLFHDVASINDYLGDSKSTVELFKRIDGSNPEFAPMVFDLADSALVDAKEYQLANKYLGDPKARLAHAKADFEDGMRWARLQIGDQSRRAFEQIFTDKVVHIITILRETGDLNGAKRIQADALEVLDSAGIRDAIKR